MSVLVTGGAGFIGCHLVRRLLDQGEEVRVLDRLSPQTHGPGQKRPALLDGRAELVVGDLLDPETLQRSLEGVERVVHLGASVGVGQSMYEPAQYVADNTLGTAMLMEAAMEQDLQKIVVASSMSIYGEGLYQDVEGRTVSARRQAPGPGHWDPTDASGRPLAPVPTPETKCPDLASVYALTKYDQERLVLMMGEAYGIPTVGLRFFNVYGPGQALQNPYTGVLAIFAARILNGQPPLVYEDGRQQRDFVYVDDVARACHLALDSERADGEAINIGTGRPRSVLEIAATLAERLGRPDVRPEVLEKARTGDVRHCIADTTKAERLLDFRAEVDFQDGIRPLVEWLADQRPEDRVPQARQELESKGLIR